MSEALNVFFGARLVGVLHRHANDELGFEYDKDWRTGGGFAISLSLPLRAEPWIGGPARQFFANLLPEGRVRQLLAQRLGLSEGNDFALLEAIGGECAGALTLLPDPEPPHHASSPEYRELTRDELRIIAREGAALASIDGQNGLRLSLAGAQDKLPVRYQDGAIYLPVAGAPSSHILKLPNPDYKHLPANEVFTTWLARRMGLPTVDIVLLPGWLREPLALVTRYDRRINTAGGIDRLHQEDLCQAASFAPTRKYETEGGPSFKRCFELIAAASTEPLQDTQSLLDWQFFNALVGNADGHAKNLSILLDGQQRRMAPFYDLVCTRAFPRLSRALAMRIGGETDSGQLRPKHLEVLATETGTSARYLRSRLAQVAGRAEQAAGETVDDFRRCYGKSAVLQIIPPIVHKLARSFTSRLTTD